MTGTTTIPVPPSEARHAIPTRMHAQLHREVEGQQTDDAATLSAARRVVAMLDAPAPADAPDSDTLTVRSVEAAAAVYGLLADAEEGLMFCNDRDGVEWVVGPHVDHKGLVAWGVWDSVSAPIPLRELVAEHGPLSIVDSVSLIQFDGFGPADPGAEMAARIMSLLQLHGIHATAVASDSIVSVWDAASAVTTAEWNRRVRATLRKVYGVLADDDNADGALELVVHTAADGVSAPEGKVDAWIAVRRNHSPYAEGPEWERDALVLFADDVDEIAYRVGRGDEMLPLYADGEGTLGARDLAAVLNLAGEATR